MQGMQNLESITAEMRRMGASMDESAVKVRPPETRHEASRQRVLRKRAAKLRQARATGQAYRDVLPGARQVHAQRVKHTEERTNKHGHTTRVTITEPWPEGHQLAPIRMWLA